MILPFSEGICSATYFTAGQLGIGYNDYINKDNQGDLTMGILWTILAIIGLIAVLSFIF